MRQFLTPRWWGLHVLMVVAVLITWRFGLWQWHKARGQGDWVNYGYAVQWWLFTGFAVALWGKWVLDELHPERVVQREEQARRRDRGFEQLGAPASVVPPTDEQDEELAAYNRHLAWLHENSRR